MVANRVQRRNYRKLTASYQQVRKGERRERGRGGEGGDERKGERRGRGEEGKGRGREGGEEGKGERRGRGKEGKG